MHEPRFSRGAFARLRGARRARARAALAAFVALAALCLAVPAEAGGRAPGGRWGGDFAAARLRGSDVLAEAARWIGSDNMTGAVGPWCADFVSFVLRRSGRAPLANRLAASALSYGPHSTSPRPGDLVVMRTRRGRAGHVGIVEGIEGDGSIRIISGNWGHRVARAIVPRWTVTAFVEAR